VDLYLQFGYGMMEHSRRLVDRWNGGTVILSPRDLTNGQLVQLASDLTSLPGGRVLLDPQFYLPSADHKRLTGHEYWPDEYDSQTFHQGPALEQMVHDLHELNRTLGCTSFILPGLLASRVHARGVRTA
jgi:hypothetical protein